MGSAGDAENASQYRRLADGCAEIPASRAGRVTRRAQTRISRWMTTEGVRAGPRPGGTTAAVFAHVQAIRAGCSPDMAELFIDYAVNGCTPQQLARRKRADLFCVWMRPELQSLAAARASEFFYLFLLIVLGNGAIPSKEERNHGFR